MKDKNLRYVTRRVKKGRILSYWQRKGHKLERLPDDPIELYRRAKHLNDAADKKVVVGFPDGSIADVVAKYRASEGYQKLASGTKRYYEIHLKEIEDLGRSLPFSSFGRRETVDFINTYPENDRRKVAAVMRNLFNQAMYMGAATENHARDLRLPSTKRRDGLWTGEDIVRFITACQKHRMGEAIKTAFYLMQYTAQRANDVLLMRADQFDGACIRLKQQKTGKEVVVPCHTALLAILQQNAPRANLVEFNGKPLPYPTFNHAFADVRELAGLPEALQARDLRRTAMVRLSEAGCTTQEIAAISGHSIQATQVILETYIPRTKMMAENAMKKWDKSKRLDKKRA